MNNKSNTETAREMSLEDIGAGVTAADARIRVLLERVMAQRRCRVRLPGRPVRAGEGDEELAATAEQMSAQTNQLQELMGFFTVDTPHTPSRRSASPLVASPATALPRPRARATQLPQFDDSTFEQF